MKFEVQILRFYLVGQKWLRVPRKMVIWEVDQVVDDVIKVRAFCRPCIAML